jgi:hypothetical protein
MTKRAVLALLMALAWPLTSSAGAQQEAADSNAQDKAQAEVQADLYEEAMTAITEGRRSAASTILAQMIAQGPNDPGGWMDLAMLQCALGHGDEAEQLFRSIETKLNPPQNVRDIIAQQRANGCLAAALRKQWGVSVARGYESNVNQGASNPFFELSGSNTPLQLQPEYLPQGDQYSIVSGDYLQDLSQDGDVGFLQLHVRHNDRLSKYNTISLFGGVDHPLRWKRWKGRATAIAGALTLDGRLYQQQAGVQLRVVPPVPLPQRWELSFQTGLTHLAYKTLNNFDSNSSELRSTLTYRTSEHQAQFTTGVTNDHAVAERPGGNRHGWQAGFNARSRLWGDMEGEFDLSRQHWQGQSVYSPGLIDIIRDQDTRTIRGTLLYPLSQRAVLLVDLRHVRNHENISIFQYNNRQIQVSLRWLDSK